MKALIIFLALITSTWCQTTKVISFADLQNYWPFEDLSGGTTAARFGGINGTVTGATLVTGILGKALSFNGTSDLATFSTAFRPAVSQQWSVSFWFKPSVVDSTLRVIFNNFNAVTNIGIALDITSANKLGCLVASSVGNTRRADSTAAITQGVWHHAVGTWDGSATPQCYLDSVAGSIGFSQGTVGTISYTETMTAGRFANQAVDFFGGLLDDIKCYNHAMNQSEVNYLFYSRRYDSGN